jgi:hypothetical protein
MLNKFTTKQDHFLSSQGVSELNTMQNNIENFKVAVKGTSGFQNS